MISHCSPIFTVAPLVGAWIEIVPVLHISLYGIQSLPLWERGLKLGIFTHNSPLSTVAPLVGAWIEIASNSA